MAKNIIKNDSKGYGYDYASLSDIAKQGYEIPKMTTGTDPNTMKDYVYYLDGEQWLRGAEIVIPEGKMNKAQLYGSALTYARRYTTLMALSLACDDDKAVEDLAADGSKKGSNLILESKVREFESLYTTEEQCKIFTNYKVKASKDLDPELLDKYINYKKYGKEQSN